MLCWVNKLRMLSLSNLHHNDELNNQAWMREWHLLSWLKLECSVNTGLVNWLILVCWSSIEEVTIVVFHTRRAPWMLTQQSYLCAPLNVDWIYEWMATFSTFHAMSRWLHFWESVAILEGFPSLQANTWNNTVNVFLHMRFLSNNINKLRKHAIWFHDFIGFQAHMT